MPHYFRTVGLMLDLFPGDRLALLAAIQSPSVTQLFSDVQDLMDFMEGMGGEFDEIPRIEGWNGRDTQLFLETDEVRGVIVMEYESVEGVDAWGDKIRGTRMRRPFRRLNRTVRLCRTKMRKYFWNFGSHLERRTMR